jgi:NitT/TauT family transport system substrate-binding protein
MRRFLRSLMILGVVACAASVHERGARAEEITVTQWGVGFYGLPFAVAMEKGYLKEAGIDITSVLSAAGGGTAVRNMMASGLPYGEVALSAALAAYNQGLPIVMVNVACRSIAEFAWLTKPDSDVHSIKDLAGKKVSFTNAKSVTEMLLLMSLDAAGVPRDSVTRIASGGYGPGLTLMESGSVAAAPAVEPARTIDKNKYRVLFAPKDLLPPMVIDVGITTKEFAAAHPEKLRAIIAGRAKGVDYLYAHVQESAQIGAKTFQNLDPKVAEEAVGNLAQAHLWTKGEFVKAELEQMANGLRLVGELKGDVDWKAMIDDRYLPADMRGLR